ncbi:hypothetical protein JQ604_23600 [Bradyrhizobium jicamae]|uniref:hypothetical protein n=1 Tax=Bradyrhizobium jicamae TaxID=280332 RepID=UPI001BABDE29|nr:hypothetical protein [Bradyrhizobium jicamae]MBR0755181.1 hypothetical protein [Bradyrhizobium jicamae]
MTPSQMRDRLMRTARTAASTWPVVMWADAALASQGPGAGMGTASHLTQVTMAVLVYGTSAIVIAPA